MFPPRLSFRAAVLSLFFFAQAASFSFSEEPPVKIAGLTRVGVGVTRDNKTIYAHIPNDWFSAKGEKTRVLFIAGTEQAHNLHISQANVVAAVKWFQSLTKGDDSLGFDPGKFSVAMIPSDAIARGPWPGRQYPPTERYDSKTQSAEAYLWNWIGMEAPDLVVVIHDADDLKDAKVYFPYDYQPLEELSKLGEAEVYKFTEEDMAAKLAKGKPAGMGSIPALEAVIGKDGGEALGRKVLRLLTKAKFTGPSPARAEKTHRQERSAKQLIDELLHYGQKLDEIAYIPVMPLVARLELADQTGDASQREHVEKVAADFLSGAKTQKIKSGSEMAGFLLFSELAKRSVGDEREALVKLVQSAADLCFDKERKPLAIAPYHNEMSDAIFMSGPILAAAGRLTAEQKYYDACVRHIESMRKLIDREDGICRHSPLCEAAWGRGNGFVALGLALTLDDLPADHPGRKQLEVYSLHHLRALAKHQDPDGAWHQVIDEPGSYRELSATCMITFAMLRGMRSGRLSKTEFGPVADRAWLAILARVGPQGELVDVCTGTGKQKTLRDYFDRPAIFGSDPRGGGMALLVAVEKLWTK